MKKYIAILISIFFIGCGGGGGGSSILNYELEKLSTTVVFPITPIGTAIDYSDYTWSLKQTSELNSYFDNLNVDSNAHINMPSTIPTPTNKIKVAIIDQGFQYNHPDIADKIIDVHYINQTDITSSFHGTGVAGIIASTYLGVVPNNVELILINVDFDIPGEDQYIQAFQYAKQQGAQIINCSWGSSFDDSSYGFSQTYLDVLNDLKNNNIHVVFAAGNDSSDLDNNWNTDAEIEFVLGVGATSKDNILTDYSNYGSQIDIYAPGGDSNLGLISLDLTGSQGNNSFDSNYNFWTGTSFSTPTISGVIAILLSIDNTLTPDEIRNVLINNSDIIDGIYSKVNVQQAIDNLP